MRLETGRDVAGVAAMWPEWAPRNFDLDDPSMQSPTNLSHTSQAQETKTFNDIDCGGPERKDSSSSDLRDAEKSSYVLLARARAS